MCGISKRYGSSVVFRPRREGRLAGGHTTENAQYTAVTGTRSERIQAHRTLAVKDSEEAGAESEAAAGTVKEAVPATQAVGVVEYSP